MFYSRNFIILLIIKLLISTSLGVATSVTVRNSFNKLIVEKAIWEANDVVACFITRNITISWWLDRDTF